MRFIKCLSVLSFAVGDGEGCRTAPVEAELSSVPVLRQTSTSFQLVVSFASRPPASGVCRGSITSTLADCYSLYIKLIKYQTCNRPWRMR